MTMQAPNEFRVKDGQMGTDHTYGPNGLFMVGHLKVIASDGEGWEHVSVSTSTRCPDWEEMCMIKDLFWGENDCVIQYHPPRKNYVNCHKHCLHLWRPSKKKIPLPPMWMVGPK